ncbi:hypothetical protein GQ53DRAFT_707658 [Thozetella sp. PMI_491]|nr:hypothetical protein GQ53DRAFT_707658 [Thozetella sp. PMI_491]
MISHNIYDQGQGFWLRKSRTGCRDCRLRKVKCDEIKPVCSNCRRRYVTIQHCDWNARASRSKHFASREYTRGEVSGDLIPHDASASALDRPAPSLRWHPSSAASPTRLRATELRLIYHYADLVRYAMPECDGTTGDVWQRIIPQLSFESELILNPMLTLSALHLHSYLPNDSTVSVALRQYLDRTLVNQRQALLNPTGGPVEQLLLSAVLLCHIHWLLAHKCQTDEQYELPLQVFKTMEGVGVIFLRNKAFLSQLGYRWFVSEPLPNTLPRQELSVSAQAQLQNVEDDLTCLLNAFNISTLPEDDRSIYLNVKEYVLHQYQAFYSGAAGNTLRLFVSFMAMRCEPRYYTMLERHDTLAMALMARIMVLLKAVGHAWWVNGEGEYEVVQRNIRGIFELIPADLRWVMNWPCKVLAGEITISGV